MKVPTNYTNCELASSTTGALRNVALRAVSGFLLLELLGCNLDIPTCAIKLVLAVTPTSS